MSNYNGINNNNADNNIIIFEDQNENKNSKSLIQKSKKNPLEPLKKYMINLSKV